MSVSSVSLNSDANVRYQRLATEYSKLRSQAKVLREGVLAERAKVDSLTNDVKAKDATIRKIRTENESLLFRNEQLVRRVENLQIDIENGLENGAKKGSKKIKTAQKDDSNEIQSMKLKIELLEEELRDKLRQNEELVSKLAENERLYSEEIAQLSEKFARQIRNLEMDLEETRKKKAISNNSEETKIPTFSDYEAKSERTVSPISNSEDVLPDIGSPTPPDSIEEASKMLVVSLRSTIDTFHTTFNLLQQRTDIYPYDATMEPLPLDLQKLSLGYAQCSKLFADTNQVVAELLEREVFDIEKDVPIFISKIDVISKHCGTILFGLIKRMLSEENKVNWCTPPLETLNEQWAKYMENLFEKFAVIVRTLEKREICDIMEEVGNLLQICTDLSDIYSKRWMFEARLPTTTRRMKCVGIALEKVLKQLVIETGKMNARAHILHKMMISKEAEVEEEEEEDLKKEQKNMVEYKDEPKENVEMVSLPVSVEENNNEKKEMKVLKIEIEVLREKVQELQLEKDKLNINLSLLKRKSELANGNQRIELSDVEHLREIRKEQMFELLKRVEESECTSRFYKNECEMLIMLHLSSEEERKNVELSLERIAHEKNIVEDELESVRRGYDAQIIELSEHIAKLMDQKEAEGEEAKDTRTVQRAKSGLKSFFKS